VKRNVWVAYDGRDGSLGIAYTLEIDRSCAEEEAWRQKCENGLSAQFGFSPARQVHVWDVHVWEVRT